MRRRIYFFGIALLLAIAVYLTLTKDTKKPMITGSSGRTGHSATQAKPLPADSDSTSKTRPRPKTPARSVTQSAILEKYGQMSYNGSKFITVDSSGKLTPQCIEFAGISTEEATQLQSIFESHRQNMIKLIRDNITVSEDTDSKIPNSVSLTVKAFPDQGLLALDNLVSAIDAKLGREKREKILSGYGIRGNFFTYGSENARINILETPNIESEISGSTQISFSTFDPITGEQTSMGQYSLYAVSQHYGDIFSKILKVKSGNMEIFQNQ